MKRFLFSNTDFTDYFTDTNLTKVSLDEVNETIFIF